MGIPTARKGEACIGERFEQLVFDLIAIIGFDAPDIDGLFFVGPHLVIEYNIVDHTILGRDRSFLLQFTKVEQIVGVVTD